MKNMHDIKKLTRTTEILRKLCEETILVDSIDGIAIKSGIMVIDIATLDV